MVCPECGRKSEGNEEVCIYCGFRQNADDVFVWNELPAMPEFPKKFYDKSDGGGKKRNGSGCTGMKSFILRFTAVFIEICILAAIIAGLYIWNSKNSIITLPESENIVYSSDDIVMMLVDNQEEWSLPAYENGYNACCFLDMDFDGTPELVSIAYDSDNSVTDAKIFRVRNCKLEEIPINCDESKGFFDIGESLSLCYAADTKEMLYISSHCCDDTVALGSFYIHENEIACNVFLSRTLKDGIYSYFENDAEQGMKSITRREFEDLQSSISNRLTDLRLQYEWVNIRDIESISQQKLAALLLRSYESFNYDSSGLALSSQ